VLGPLPGPLRRVGGDATVTLRNAEFRPRRLSVPRGLTLRDP